MTTRDNPQRPENPSTYVIYDRQKDREMQRLMVQDHMLTTSMGGVLPEQPDPTTFHRVLDVGCGTGGWLIEAAKAYPWIELDGLDISQSTIAFARAQAEAQQVSDRVQFHVMDALRMIEFRTNTFDLVNLRSSVSFIRTWDWPKMLGELLRVARPGGIIRFTEGEVVPQSNSPALMRLEEMLLCALSRAGHLFTNEPGGLTNHLVKLLMQHGYQDVQTKPSTIEYRAGTPEAEASYEDTAHVFQLLRPFLQKWGCIADDYDSLYQQALIEMKQPDFHVILNFLTVWGSKPIPEEKQREK